MLSPDFGVNFSMEKVKIYLFFIVLQGSIQVHSFGEHTSFFYVEAYVPENNQLESTVVPNQNIQDLKEAKELFDTGFITKDEFKLIKQKIINGM